MEQHRAVSKMMTTLRMELEDVKLPIWFNALVREKFMQMYAAGYDQGRHDVIGKAQKKPVAQYNSDGRLINVFPGLNAASRFTGFVVNNLNHAILRERPCKGFTWRYITVDEYQEATRDKLMY